MSVASQLMDRDTIIKVDSVIDALVQRAPKIVMMQHKLTVSDVDWVLDRVKHTTHTALHEGLLKVLRTSEVQTWKADRNIVFTHRQADILSWLKFVYEAGSFRDGHRWPILIINSYCSEAQALSTFLRSVAVTYCTAHNWTPEETKVTDRNLSVISLPI